MNEIAFKSTSNWTLESQGVQELDVYDLGVENNENFFANDILVHNSNYLNLQDLVKKKFGDYKSKGISNIEIAEWLFEFIEGKDGNGMIKTFLTSSFVEMQEYLNCKNNRMNMTLEKISSNSLYKNNKKRYAMSVIYNEGTWYRNEPKLAVTGLESVSSKTPMFARKFLEEAYSYILNNDDGYGLGKLLEDQESKFYDMHIDDIAETISINKGIERINNINLKTEYNVFGVQQEPQFAKGTAYGLKAAFIHNSYNIKHNYHIKPIETNGVKVKIVPLKSPNTISSVTQNIAYVGSFPVEWNNDVYPQIDKAFIWYKRYIRTIENFTETIDYRYKSDDLEFTF